MIRRSVGCFFNGIQFDSNCCLHGLRCQHERDKYNMTNRQHADKSEKDDNITHQTYIKIRNWKKKSKSVKRSASLSNAAHSDSART